MAEEIAKFNAIASKLHRPGTWSATVRGSTHHLCTVMHESAYVDLVTPVSFSERDQLRVHIGFRETVDSIGLIEGTTHQRRAATPRRVD